jgi:hypothetical protein
VRDVRVTVTFDVETDHDEDKVRQDIEDAIAQAALELVNAGRLDTLSNVDVEVE